MRYCPVCGKIYDTKGNVCAACNEKTEDMGLDDSQLMLFDDDAADDSRAVFDFLKRNYLAACDKLTSAERSVRKALSERDAAGIAWIKHDKMMKDFNIALVVNEAASIIQTAYSDNEDIELRGDGTEG